MIRAAVVLLIWANVSGVALAQDNPGLAACTDGIRSPQERETACRRLAGNGTLDAETRSRAVTGLAEALSARGDWDGLLALGSAQLARDPSGRLGHAMVGMAYLRRQQPGDAERARDAYGEALRRFPKAFLFANNRGVARSMLGDAEGALADHSLALSLEPGYPPALIARSSLLNARGDHASAMADADLGLRSAPDNVALLEQRARALAGLNRLPEAISTLDRVVALAPKRPMIHFRRGLAKAELGQAEAAIADFTQEIVVNPTLPGAYVQRGRLVFDTQRNANRAIADFDRAIEIAPGFAMAWSQRARVRLHGGDPSGDAERDATKALALDPKDPVAKVTLAQILDGKGRANEALVLLNEAVEQMPSVVEARLLQIGVMMRLGLHEGALQSARAGLRLEPANLDLIDVEAANLLRLGRVSEGRAALDHAIAQGRRRASTYANRAALALAMRDFTLAEGDVAAALRLEGGHPEANALSALLALRAKDRRKAEAAVAIVLVADPGHPIALAVQAEILRQSGKPADAQRSLVLARKRDPNAAEIVRLMLGS